MSTTLVLCVVVMITLGTTISAAAAAAILSHEILQPVYGAKITIIMDDGVAIAASGDNVYLTWPSNNTGDWEVLFRVSYDGGNTFSDKINLSNSSDSDSTFNNGIAASGDNNVYVSWSDNKTGNVETYFRVSTDGGQSFVPAVMINGTGRNLQQFEPDMGTIFPGFDILDDTLLATEIAVSGNNIYVLSWDKKSGDWEVFLAKSTDGGRTFEDTVNLSNSSDTRSDDAHMVAEENNLYITWWETAKNGTRTPLFIASNDNGQTFGPVLKLSTNGTIRSS